MYSWRSRSSSSRPYDKHDFNGFWARNPSAQYGQPPCPECRDPGPSCGYLGDVPLLTPAGEKRFEANKPTKGYLAGSKQAEEHKDLSIAYRRAVQWSESNDPGGALRAAGLTRLVSFSGGNPPIHIVQTNEVIIERFEWSWDNREIWTDGRGLPKVDDYSPRFNGYSIGTWEGDPVLAERYSRPSRNRLKLDMTLTDPENYTRPWHSNTKVWSLIPKEALTLAGWPELRKTAASPRRTLTAPPLSPRRPAKKTK